jgi:hypothetical protein
MWRLFLSRNIETQRQVLRGVQVHGETTLHTSNGGPRRAMLLGPAGHAREHEQASYKEVAAAQASGRVRAVALAARAARRVRGGGGGGDTQRSQHVL